MGALTHNGEVLQSLPADASQINFDKTGTDLNSTQTEAAIKEVNGKVNDNADEIDQLKSGLITPSGGYEKLGFGAIDSANPVVVSLGNKSISDYDVLYFCVSYYNSGVAAYGSLTIPTILVRQLYNSDAGVAFMARNATYDDTVGVGVMLNTNDNTFRFAPSAQPAGVYYVVYGVKWRTSN